MKFLNCWVGVLLTLFCYVCCLNEDVINVEKQYEEKISERREAKQLRKPIEQEGWRVVEPHNRQDSGEWIPKDSAPFDSDDPEKPIPRRRRIRKRKRRPPQFILSSEESEAYPPLRRRRIRPQTLQDTSDHWSNMEEESPRRPYNRRRTTPVYLPEIETEENVEVEPLSAVLHFEEDKTEKPRVYEKVRDPFTALEEAEAKARLKKKQQGIEQNREEIEKNREQETTTVSHLKALLKQSGASLSLSELLQQKNLSLDDLLNGKQQAISALTEKSEIVTEYKNPKELDFTETPKIIQTHNLKYTENSTPFNKNTNRNYVTLEDSSESNTSKDAQRNRLSLLHNNEGVKLFTSKNYEVVTEPTTERRIFVPSNTKHYSSFNYKPSITKTPTTQATKTFSTEKYPTTNTTPILSTHTHILGNKYLDYRSKYVSLRPKLKTLPITSAKLNRLVSKRPGSEMNETTPIPLFPPNAFKIDIKDLLAIKETPTIKPKEDGPMKLTFDIEKLMEQAITEKTTTEYNSKFDWKTEKEVSENEVTTEIKTNTESWFNSEKIKPTSARDEIMEILRDHGSRENLSRILELRNMTIEELVAQRERGSSQLHLADIFHNQTREPEPPNEPYIGHIRSITNSVFDRKPKTIRNSVETKSVVDVIKPQLNQEGDLHETPNKPEVPVYTVTSFPTYKIEMEKIMKNNPPFQISLWKNLYPDLYTGGFKNSNQEEDLDVSKPTDVEDILQNDIRRVEDVENTISEAVNGQLNIELNENNYEDVNDYITLPRGVKSTIIVSVAIIGISVFVFLTVFVIFKWLQRQKKKRLCYSNSFSCSRIKSPILETRPKRTIRTIMSETLGRKKKYSNVYPQSMSDYVWESDKKPFQ